MNNWNLKSILHSNYSDFSPIKFDIHLSEQQQQLEKLLILLKFGYYISYNDFDYDNRRIKCEIWYYNIYILKCIKRKAHWDCKQ